MMIRGCHRGLPYHNDRAIMLPAERDLNERDSFPTTVDLRKAA